MQPHPAARLQHGGDVEQAEDVRGRGDDLHAVGRGHPQGVAPVPHARREGPVGVADGLGQARRTRTEDQHRIGVGIRLRDGRPTRGDRLVEMQHRHQPGQHRVVAHRVMGAADGQRVADLGGLPCGADQHCRGAQLPDRAQRDDEFGPVGRHQRHPLAGVHTALGQSVGQPGRKGLDLRSCIREVVECEYRRVAHAALRWHMVSDNPIDGSENENILSSVENCILVWVE